MSERPPAVTVAGVVALVGTLLASGGALHPARSQGTEPGKPDTADGETSAVTRHHLQILTGAIAAVLLAAGCSTGDAAPTSPITQTTTHPVSTTTTSSPTSSAPTYSSAARPAVEAYLNFYKSATMASKHPLPPGQTYTGAADFTKYSFDPARVDHLVSLTQLYQTSRAFKGVPSSPRPIVLTLQTKAAPYPKAVLEDCRPLSPTWKLYNIKTGQTQKDVAEHAPGTAAPPYLSTITVIYYQGHWGVQSMKFDTSKTCKS